MSESQYVVFKINEEEYGVEITTVEEILKYQEITKVPQADEFVLGVINLRGKVIPVYNLKKKFYQEDLIITDDTRIVVINYNGVGIGLIVDSVSEVLKISEDHIDLTETIFSAKSNKAIIGIGKIDNRLLMIIDINELFSESEKSRIMNVV